MVVRQKVKQRDKDITRQWEWEWKWMIICKSDTLGRKLTLNSSRENDKTKQNMREYTQLIKVPIERERERENCQAETSWEKERKKERKSKSIFIQIRCQMHCTTGRRNTQYYNELVCATQLLLQWDDFFFFNVS